MNLELLIQICGMPSFVTLAVLSLVLAACALLLIFRAKRELLLAAFFPLCFLPLLVACVTSLAGMTSAVAMQLDGEEEMLRDPAFFLLTNMVPLFLGATASALPATITMLGRWTLAWRASGLKLLPSRPKQDRDEGGFNPDAWADKEADDYIDQLIRPR